MRCRTTALAALALAGCLPIHEVVRNNDSVLQTIDATSGRGEPAPEVKVDSSSTQLALTVETVTTCVVEQKQRVRRIRVHQRSTNHGVHAATYILGIAGTLVGAGIAADNLTNGTTADRRFQIGDTVEQGRNIGIGIGAVGAILLFVALGGSAQAADSSDVVGTLDLPVDGTRHKGECDRGPAVNTQVGLVFTTDGTARVYVPVGKTDAGGHVSASWGTIASHLPPTARPEGSVVIGEPDVIGALLVKNGAVPTLASVVAPTVADSEQLWSAAVALDTFDAYRGFRERFPGSPHVPEAIERAKAAHIRTAQRDFDAAIAANDLDKAAKALASLRTFGDPASVAAAQERLEKLQSLARSKDLATRLPALLAAIDGAEDPSVAIARARAAIDQIRTADPELAAGADAQLATARDQATARLVRDGQEAAMRRDFAAAARRFDAAAAIAKDAQAVEKARTAAFERAVRAGHDAARELARQNRYDEAIALVDTLVAVAPQDKTLAADRGRWDAAAKRALQSETERQAREDQQRRAREEREATAQAARDRAARDEADRRARDEAARATAEQRRLAAAQDKARQQAAEAARIDEARRAAEAARVAQEEARRREAAAKLDAQVAREQQPATPVTVQFELPARYATDDVLKRLPVPKSCTANISSALAKPTTCKDCAPRSISRVEMKCGPLGFSFVRDQTHVWITCRNDKQATCGDCLAAGQSALAPFVEAKEKLQVVQGCGKPR